MRPEPCAPIVVRVREHAARAKLAHARAARGRGHEAVGAAHKAVAAVEHERAREPRVAEARGVDRLQAAATREHLVRAGHAGEVLEAPHLGAVRERVEPVVAVRQAQAPDGAVDVDLLHQQLYRVVGACTRGRVARRVDLEDLHDAPAGDGGAPLVVVDLQRAVVQEQGADLVAHVPFERQDGGCHVARRVERALAVLPAYGVGDVREHRLGKHTRLQRHVGLLLIVASVRAVESCHGSSHLAGLVQRGDARLVADRVGYVSEYARGNGAYGHQNSSSSRLASAAMASSTYCLVA